jgi:MFS family permease
MSVHASGTLESAGHWQPRPLRSGEVRFGTWIAFFAWVFAVYDFVLFGTLLPRLGTEFNWSPAHQTAIATWIATGTAVVALLIGPLVDRLGRRKGIMFTVGGAAICSALTAIGGAAGSVVLVLIRSLSGLGYAEEGVNATYLTELYAATDDPRLAERRGFIYSLVQGGWPVGALLAAALTAILLPLIGWRGCFVFAAVPSLVIAFLARRLRESPQFELQQEIRRLRANGQEAVGRSLAHHHDVDYEGHEAASLAAAFRGPALRATLTLGGGFLLNWFTIQIFSVLGTTVITSVHHISFNNSLLILILSNLAGYCGYLTHGYFGDRIGRRNVIALGWMLGGIAFTAMLYGPHDIVFVVALYSIGLFFLTGPYAALLFFMGESFPTEIRATGGSIIHCMGPIGAILAGIGVTRFLAEGAGWQSAAFWFGAVPCFVSGLLMFTARHVNPADVK